MPSNKDRIYIALYARGGGPKMPGEEDRYHWAILIGPKTENASSVGTRFHAKEGLVKGGNASGRVFAFEEKTCSMLATMMVLVRVRVGKIADKPRALNVLRGTAVRSNTAGWNCVSWVEEALEGLARDPKALGRSVTDWQKVRDAAMKYAGEKVAGHRFDGQAASFEFDDTKVATWDLLQGVELIP